MRLALPGDTMLGRGVAERLAFTPPESLFAPEPVGVAREAEYYHTRLVDGCCARG